MGVVVTLRVAFMGFCPGVVTVVVVPMVVVMAAVEGLFSEVAPSPDSKYGNEPFKLGTEASWAAAWGRLA